MENQTGGKKIYFLYVLVACAGIFITNELFNYINRTNVFVSEAKEIKPLSQKEASVINLRADKSKKTKKNVSKIGKAISESSFSLSGVFFSGDTGYAIINERVVQEGDTMGNSTVMRISPEEIEIKTGETIEKISTRLK
jgi:hypothetical protein